MPRRSSQPLTNPPLLGFSIAIGVLWLIVQLLSHASFALMLFVLPIGAAAVAFWRRDHIRRSLLQKSQAIIAQHIRALLLKKTQLVWQDAYGKLHGEQWEKEKNFFIAQHIAPCLDVSERRALHREHHTVAWHIEGQVNAAAQRQPAYRDFLEAMTPAEFELFCAEQLRQAGWHARVTQQSRDQGVDVIAEKDGMRVVLQCKLYTQPVGNKAVQEVTAARGYEQAHYGVVVTNNRYTSAAEQLASTNRILLLHYSQLQNLKTLLCSQHISKEPDHR